VDEDGGAGTISEEELDEALERLYAEGALDYLLDRQDEVADTDEPVAASGDARGVTTVEEFFARRAARRSAGPGHGGSAFGPRPVSVITKRFGNTEH
jgi:hypothetical protein